MLGKINIILLFLKSNIVYIKKNWCCDTWKYKGDVIKVMEKSIFIHNIDVSYIGDYTVIDKLKDYKS